MAAIVAAGAAAAQTLPATPMILLPMRAIDLPDPGTLPDPDGALNDLPLVRLGGGQDGSGTLAWFRVRTRVRDSRAVADFYPVAGSGVRFSGGTRLQAGWSQTAVAPDTRLALRNDPWRSRGPASLGGGYQSFAPVAMVGYSQGLSEHWRLGVDAGAMRGRMVSIYPFDGSAGRGSGPSVDGADRVNPMMDLTVAYAF